MRQIQRVLGPGAIENTAQVIALDVYRDRVRRIGYQNYGGTKWRYPGDLAHDTGRVDHWLTLLHTIAGALVEKNPLGEWLQAHFEDFRNQRLVRRCIRRSQQWRADVGFLDSRIRPQLDQTTATLFAVERGVTEWAVSQVHSIQIAANRISLGLWVIAVLALGFVILNYAALRRSVFDPMQKVAHALNAAANNDSRAVLPAERSPEVSSLVQAFRIFGAGL